MRVLIACEESQAVTIEMRKLNIEAYSCDIIPCSGGHPEWHIQADVLSILDIGWDLMIAFPPCTYLTVTGNRWFDIKRYGEKAIQRYKDREYAIEFFMKLVNADVPYRVIENPIGIMSTQYRKPDQIIQPYEFGDPYEKRTCLWLYNLPRLIPTKIVSPERRIVYKSGATSPGWHGRTLPLEHSQRKKLRSKTFTGIAKAMAEQWGGKLVQCMI
jgi:hypothetical protein